MARIAVLDDYQEAARRFADWTRLERQHEVKFYHQPFRDEAEAAAALVGFEIVCAMRERTRLSRSLIERLPNLKLIATTGMRNAAIDMKAAAERGIIVCGTGSGAVATPELTFALMLGLARHLTVEAANMREGRWQTTVGLELAGKTLGLLGLGRLGGHVARIAAAFDMRLIAWSQNLTEARAAECGARRVEKDELFREADILTIHLILSGRTRGLVGARELALMKPTALLINTSRGPIVDEAALLAALQAGRLGGAGIDVYSTEPLPADHPLRTAPRTLLTPHIGYVTAETYRRFYGETVENIEAWLAGAPKRVMT